MGTLADGGDEGKEVALNQSYLVQKLLPYTNYTFYIRAYSGRSASEQSQRVTCKTGESGTLLDWTGYHVFTLF